MEGLLPKGSTAQWGLWASANRLPQSHSMKNRTYIRYSRIFPTVAWVRISRRISLPHYTVLLSLFLQFPWNPSLPTAVQSPITMNRAVFRDKPAQERTEKRFSYSDGTDPLPWKKWLSAIPPCLCSGECGSKPYPPEIMPRLYLPQNAVLQYGGRGSPLPENRLRQGLDVWERMPLSRLKSTWDQSHSVPVTVSRSTSRVS